MKFIHIFEAEDAKDLQKKIDRFVKDDIEVVDVKLTSVIDDMNIYLYAALIYTREE